jgi:hypothetical protein
MSDALFRERRFFWWGFCHRARRTFPLPFSFAGVLLFAAALDQKVDALNNRAPGGVNPLPRVEAAARGISAVRDKPFLLQVQLPKLPLIETSGPAPLAWPPAEASVTLAYVASVAAACGVPSTADDHNWDFVFDESVGHYVHRRKAGAPPSPPFHGAPEPMQPGETQHQYILRMQQKNAEESARHVAYGMADERERERLRSVQK